MMGIPANEMDCGTVATCPICTIFAQFT
jgi:hypothetical protein